MGRGFAWLDSGTHENLLQASLFIKTVEEMQSLKIACLEEIAYKLGYIDDDKLRDSISKMKNIKYSNYLLKLI